MLNTGHYVAGTLVIVGLLFLGWSLYKDEQRKDAANGNREK